MKKYLSAFFIFLVAFMLFAPSSSAQFRAEPLFAVAGQEAVFASTPVLDLASIDFSASIPQIRPAPVSVFRPLTTYPTGGWSPSGTGDVTVEAGDVITGGTVGTIDPCDGTLTYRVRIRILNGTTLLGEIQQGLTPTTSGSPPVITTAWSQSISAIEAMFSAVSGAYPFQDGWRLIAYMEVECSMNPKTIWSTSQSYKLSLGP